ncbi:MAG: class II aldolase/adducin family protein [Candidatus Micrarchaeota archaeon]
MGVKFQIIHEDQKAEGTDVAKIVGISEKLSQFFDPKENEGNLSIRCSVGNSFVIKKTGSKLTNMKEEDVVLVTKIGGNEVFANGTPSSEARMHYEIYCKLNGVNIVLHFHDNKLMDNKGLKIEEIGPFEYGTSEVAEAATQSLKSTDFIKLRKHGFILVASNEKELFDRLGELYK